MKRLFLLFYFCTLLLPLTAEAADYYVTKTGGGTTCSLAAPCLTINIGIGKLAASDTLFIGPGTYDERLSTSIPSGTALDTTKLIASGGTGTVIVLPTAVNGTGLLTGISGSKNHITFDGIVFDATNVVSPDDSNTADAISLNTGSDSIMFTNFTIRNTGAQNGPTGNPGNGIGIGGTNHVFSNCNAHDNGKATDAIWTAGAYAFYVGTGSGHTIDNCQIYRNGGYGVHIYGSPSNITVKNSTFYENSQVSVITTAEIIVSSGANHKVFNNVFRDGLQGGIQVYSGCSSCLIYSNTVYRNARWGIKVEGGSATIRNNIIANNNTSSGGHINFEDNVGITKSNNACFGTGGTTNCNVTTDVGFVNASANNFNLSSASSSAVDAGFTLGSPYNVDILGIPRPQAAAYDIGAYEFGIFPTVTITQPSGCTGTSAACTVTSSTVTVSGTSDLVSGIISWTCDRCTPSTGSTTTGTINAWTLFPALTLKAGINILVVTATTAGGAASSDTITITYAPTFPGNALVLAMPFENGSGSTVTDTTDHLNHGTLVGSPTWLGASGGRFGNAVQFDGIAQHMTVVDSNSLDFTQSLTLSLWVKSSASISDYRSLISKVATPIGSPYGLFAGVLGECGTGGISGFVRSNGASGPTDQACHPTALVTNNWTHLAFTYDGTNLRLYKNGVLMTTTPHTGYIEPSTQLLYVARSEFGEYFAGAIDELRIYNYAIPLTDGVSNVTPNAACSAAVAVSSPSVIGDMNCPIIPLAPPIEFKVSATSTIKLGADANQKIGGPPP